MTSSPKSNLQGRGLMLIAAFKIFKGVLLLAVGFGALHFLHRDLAMEAAHWVDLLRIDPHGRYLQWILEKVSKVDEKKLREFSVATFIYASLFLCEGAGLALRKKWAAYLTIVSTASLLPLEVFEIYRHPSFSKAAILIVNLAVVGYLLRELRKSK
jgi:uncharacterized membrane protein (DUF2068 family)